MMLKYIFYIGLFYDKLSRKCNFKLSNLNRVIEDSLNNYLFMNASNQMQQLVFWLVS